MNSFGRIFRLSIFGESHGPVTGIVIDGCPAGIALHTDDFREDLCRRQTGARGTSPRREEDEPEILSGVFNGHTTGAPLLILFRNQDADPGTYASRSHVPRPGHADFTAREKFGGYHDYRGGGHFSGRLTLPLVAAGVVAKKIIAPVKVFSTLLEAGGVRDIQAVVEQAWKEHDSIGGLVECRASGLPAGLGEPFFDSVESLVSHLFFSIPAVKGVEFGAGFHAARMRGCEHNDAFIRADGKTSTNHDGGINGGITNGNEIVCRLAVKPASSIGKKQPAYDFRENKVVELELTGRFDTCIALRVPVIAEASLAVVLADLMLLEQNVPRVMPRA